MKCAQRSEFIFLVQFELILKIKIKKLAGQSVESQVEQVVSHDEVLTVGKEKAVVMMDLIQKIVSMTV